jgi:hypothetical protein
LRVWNDPREKNLFLLAMASFVFLCIVEIRLPLASAIQGTQFGNFLGSDATKNVVASLLSGILSAYIFYIFIDHIPRVRREKNVTEVLNSLLASVLGAYDRGSMFGHETAISSASKEVLEKGWIDEQLTVLRKNTSTFLKLKYSMQTAHSRLEDFRHSLSLALSISPEHAIRWLVITDKIRLFADIYNEKQPEVPGDKMCFVDKDTEDNPIRYYKSSLNSRFLEIVEETRRWLYTDVIDNG